MFHDIFQSVFAILYKFLQVAKTKQIYAHIITSLICYSKYILSLGHGKCTLCGATLSLHEFKLNDFFVWHSYPTMFFFSCSRKCNFHFAWWHMRDPGLRNYAYYGECDSIKCGKFTCGISFYGNILHLNDSCRKIESHFATPLI